MGTGVISTRPHFPTAVQGVPAKAKPFAAPAVLICLAFASHEIQAAPRAYVASSGNDANSGVGCLLTAPCRSFAAAHSVVDSGGEIVALDAAGYGAVTITKSVTITANPGYFAGIAASTGNAVTIATPDVKVVLRGLNINGIGAAYGILMSAGAELNIENCVISNFADGGVVVQGNVQAKVVGSLVRGSGYAGLRFDGASKADVSNSQALNNDWVGVWARDDSRLVVTDVIASGNGWGIAAAGNAVASAIRTTAAHNRFAGFQSEGAGTLTVGYSQASNNLLYGFNQITGSVFQTMGNNLVVGNGSTASLGTLTPISGL